MSSNSYAQPDVLVTTEWAEAHLNDPSLRFVEVDVDTAAYDTGHVPGAIGWNWTTDTQDTVRRDIPDKTSFEALLGRSGIGNDTTVVLYGDNNNWFATYAFWLFKLYGHGDVRLIDGGRQKWLAEERPLTTEAPAVESTTYTALEPNTNLRALRRFVEDTVGSPARALVDVRSSHTWFVLHYLLGYPDVRNYDGSWTEWGSAIGVPIEKTFQGDPASQ